MASANHGRFGFIGALATLTSHSSFEWVNPSRWLVAGKAPLAEPVERRFWPVYLVLAVAFGVIGVRLVQLQVGLSDENRLLADGNRVRREITVAARGAIVDTHGASLVVNEPTYRFDLIPSDLPLGRDDRLAVLASVARAKGLVVETVVDKVNRAGLTSHDPVTLVDGESREVALLDQITFSGSAGVRLSLIPSRRYDATDGLGHILGYVGPMTENDTSRHPDYYRQSPIGKSGLESSYDQLLRGEVGVTDIEVNAAGKFQRALQKKPSKPGQTLRLTLDRGLQNELAAALNDAMTKQQVGQAVGVAMNPNTGAILASVSLPGYDNNAFSHGISAIQYHAYATDDNKPLLNRAADGLYPSGSTIKPFLAAAALTEKTINAQTTLDTSAGVIEVGEFKFPDWKRHGLTNVTRAIAESNDIFFYALGGGYQHIPPLGIDRLDRYLNLFGFGQGTGVDYTSENTGLVPGPDWKKRVKRDNWYLGDTYHVSIGQGDLLVTPLQMVRALASVVNGGRLVTPHVVAATQDSATGRTTTLSFPEKSLPIPPAVLALVDEGMRLAVNSDTGSARSLRAAPFSSGGKTGTAQFGSGDNQKTHAWYLGYAPAESPQIVVAVIVEGGGEGNAISIPVAARAMSYFMAHRPLS